MRTWPEGRCGRMDGGERGSSTPIPVPRHRSIAGEDSGDFSTRIALAIPPVPHTWEKLPRLLSAVSSWAFSVHIEALLERKLRLFACISRLFWGGGCGLWRPYRVSSRAVGCSVFLAHIEAVGEAFSVHISAVLGRLKKRWACDSLTLTSILLSSERGIDSNP